MSSSMKIDNRKKDLLILGKGPTQRLKHILSAGKCVQLFLQAQLKFLYMFALQWSKQLFSC